MVAIPDRVSEKCEYKDDRKIASSRCSYLKKELQYVTRRARAFISLALAR